ncbi:MAG TPA: hypothetical protein VGH58_04120 [Solirubrobacterales bacterium]|jgi:hypothetical protein
MKSIRIGLWALAVLAIAIAIAGCGSSKTHGEEGTLKLTEPGSAGSGKSFGIIGQATKKGIKPGNGFAFSSPLEESGGKTVGEINAICIATQPSPGEGINGTCSGTATVPGGGFALNVGGKEVGGGGVSGSITGGTGKYAGAVGTFTSKEEGAGSGEEGPSTLIFNYTLP